MNYNKFKNQKLHAEEAEEISCESVEVLDKSKLEDIPCSVSDETYEVKEDYIIDVKMHNCTLLNLRTTPDENAEVITVIDTEDKIKIDPEYDNMMWVKARVEKHKTKDVLYGFCMKKYMTKK